MASAYFFFHKPFSERFSTLPDVFYFLRRGIMEPALCVLVDCPPPQFDHVSKCSIWDFLRDEAMWKKIWLFTRSCFHEKILEFQSYSEKSF
jgi:hypothetical protein